MTRKYFGIDINVMKTKVVKIGKEKSDVNVILEDQKFG